MIRHVGILVAIMMRPSVVVVIVVGVVDATILVKLLRPHLFMTWLVIVMMVMSVSMTVPVVTMSEVTIILDLTNAIAVAAFA